MFVTVFLLFRGKETKMLQNVTIRAQHIFGGLNTQNYSMAKTFFLDRSLFSINFVPCILTSYLEEADEIVSIKQQSIQLTQSVLDGFSKRLTFQNVKKTGPCLNRHPTR